MGGGKNFQAETKEELCQMCDQVGHTATLCPWIYNKCIVPSCNGLMMLKAFEAYDNQWKKGLKCQYANCHGFTWLEDELRKFDKGKGVSSSSSSSTQEDKQKNIGCFHCGEEDHWANNCPWKNSVCKHGCEGSRKLLTSRQQHSLGKKFLKCLKCGDFEWLATAILKCRKTNVRVKIEVSLDDMCNDFSTKM